jgi:hypothetical protein
MVAENFTDGGKVTIVYVLILLLYYKLYNIRINCIRINLYNYNY